MTKRAYTVSELDALRRAVENKWLFGTYDPYLEGAGQVNSRAYNQTEKAKCVEELVRTHMLAGHIAEDLYASERRRCAGETMISQQNTAADFQVGDIVCQDECDAEYEVLALHPGPASWGGTSDSDTMTLRCLIDDGETPPYMEVGEVYDYCKCRRFELKRRASQG